MLDELKLLLGQKEQNASSKDQEISDRMHMMNKEMQQMNQQAAFNELELKEEHRKLVRELEERLGR